MGKCWRSDKKNILSLLWEIILSGRYLANSVWGRLRCYRAEFVQWSPSPSPTVKPSLCKGHLLKGSSRCIKTYVFFVPTEDNTNPPNANTLKQCCQTELSVTIEMFCVWMSNTAATSHMGLFSAWNVASETEEMNFYLYFNEFKCE